MQFGKLKETRFPKGFNMIVGKDKLLQFHHIDNTVVVAVIAIALQFGQYACGV